MKLFTLVLVATSLHCPAGIGAEFPSFDGKIHPQPELDLSQLKMKATVECTQDGKSCGKREVDALIDIPNLTFSIPAIRVGPPLAGIEIEDYFEKGWGPRYDYYIQFTLPQRYVAHELYVWGWERRLDADVEYIIKTMGKMLKDLYFTAAAATKIPLRPTSLAKNLAQKRIKLEYQSLYKSAGAKEVARQSFIYPPSSFGADNSTIDIPEMLHALSHSFSSEVKPQLYVDLFSQDAKADEATPFTWRGRFIIQNGEVMEFQE